MFWDSGAEPGASGAELGASGVWFPLGFHFTENLICNFIYVARGLRRAARGLQSVLPP